MNMLSLHTNPASLAANNSLSHVQAKLSTSTTRLSTGYRVNSAMDDAAGLQIATRLKAQNSAMSVAMRNTQNSVSLLQTADGALDEVSGILVRMKDLATQAADASSSVADQDAMQSEYNTLTDELSNIMSNTSFGGGKLFNTASTGPGKLWDTAGLTFQIGADSAETMNVGFSTQLVAVDGLLKQATSGATTSTDANGNTVVSQVASRYAGDGSTLDTIYAHSLADIVIPTMVNVSDGHGGTVSVMGTVTLPANAGAAIDNLGLAIDAVSTLRSDLGAVANRLNHAFAHLSNVSTHTREAAGRILDTDFATESAAMTANQMLLQSGTAMLKQTSGMSAMIVSLLQ